MALGKGIQYIKMLKKTRSESPIARLFHSKNTKQGQKFRKQKAADLKKIRKAIGGKNLRKAQKQTSRTRIRLSRK